MIRKEWIETTDKLIQQVREKGVNLHNGEVLICKQPPPKKVGTIHVVQSYAGRQNYFEGFGRIIRLPVTGFHSTEGTIEIPEGSYEVGDFILFNHAARYKPAIKLLNQFFEMEIETEEAQDDYHDEHMDRGMLFTIPFPEIKVSKSSKAFLEGAVLVD